MIRETLLTFKEFNFLVDQDLVDLKPSEKFKTEHLCQCKVVP